MKRVAALYRLSTVRQVKRKAEDEVDIPGQRNAVTAFLQARPEWHLVAEYEEKGVSAFKVSASDRDVLQDVFRDASAGCWDALLVFKADRLSRRSLEYPMVLDRLQGLGVEVWSVADAIGGKRLALDNQMDKLVRFIEGWQAESESTNTSIRVSNRMRQIAESGRWCGGTVPFGYMLEPVKDDDGNVVIKGGRVVQQLVPHPIYAPVVREMFARYVDGKGLKAIAQWLNNQGITTYAGSAWWKNVVGGVLTNPIYAGYIAYNQRRHKRGKGEPILVMGQHEPIIDTETWERAGALRENRADLPHRQRGGTYALTGVMRCALCGGNMGGMTRPMTRNGVTKHYQSYRCLNGTLKGTCKMRTLSTRMVEANFLKAVAELHHPVGLEELVAELSTEQVDAKRRALEARERAREHLEQTRQAITRLNRLYVEAGTLTDSEYRAMKAEYLERITALEAEAAAPVPEEPEVDAFLLASAALELEANWEVMTPEERKVFVLNLAQAFDLTAVIYPDKSVVLCLSEGG